MKLHRASSTLASVIASVSFAIASIISLSAMTFAPQITTPAIAQEAGEPVTTRSGANEIALAKHLRKIGAKVYTAYWCPHCHDQKQSFGKQAVSQLEVIECDQRGVKPQRQLCTDKKIRAYPTWEIGGKFYEGDRTLDELANLSRYRGDI